MAMAMKGAMGVTLAMVIALSMILTVMAQGECSASSPCSDSSLCCSQWGYCGTGPAWCGTGCQSGPCTGGTQSRIPSGGGGRLGNVSTVLTDGDCSASSPCSDSSLCCSQWGYCGTGPAWCGTGCQNGPCTGGTQSRIPSGGGGRLGNVSTVLTDGDCSASSPCSDSSLCCSQWGYCGTGPAWCGTGCQNGPCTGGTQSRIPSGGGGCLGNVSTVLTDGDCSASSPCSDSSLCCSQWGYCGTGPAWCGTGCQNGPCTGGTQSRIPSGGGGRLGNVSTVLTDGDCSASSPCSDSSLCCSQWGYCGTGPAWCGTGCQNGPCTGGTQSRIPSGGGGRLGNVSTVLTDGDCSASSPCSDSSLCCSQWGYCGTGPAWCGTGCQSGPCTGGTQSSTPTGAGGGLGDVLTRNLYEQLFPGHLPFYTYDKLIEASKSFPQFGTTGDINTRKREIAAFAAHVTQETSGLKAIVEQTNNPYCDSTRSQFPCNGKHFNGRGPLQLSWNYNYGTCGNYLKINLLGNPDLVATDPAISFKASLWFWNQYGDNVIPHIHDAITGNWHPNNADKAANRAPGFGVTIDIINGGLECGKQSVQADNRVKYFRNFCSRLNVSPGDNVDCKNMKPFYGVKLVADS